jgi:hypothetical protein
MQSDTITVNLTKYELIVLIKNLGEVYNTVKKYLVEKGFCDLVLSKKKFLGNEIVWRENYIQEFSIQNSLSLYNECLDLIYANEGNK